MMPTFARIAPLLLTLGVGVGVARAEPNLGGQRILGVCQTLLGEESSYCDVVTDWSIEKTVDTSLVAQPNRRAVAYTVRVIEGSTRYVLGMTSIVTLDGLIPEGTTVTGMIVSFQKADPNDPNFDPLDPLSQPRHTTVASAKIGDADPACGCPFVSQGQGGGLDVTMRDELGNEIQPGQNGLIDFLAYGERMVVQLNAVYDLSAGIVLPGDSVRIQACVQYAAADEAEVSGCFDAGGTIRSVRACRGFDFQDYAEPRAAKVSLEEALGAPTEPWVILNGFKARSLSPLVTPASTLLPVMPGGAPTLFEVTASGNPGTESVISVKGDVSCGDVVDCGESAQCTAFVTNTGTLDFQDERGRVSSSVTTQVVCGAHLCSPMELIACDDGDPCTTDTCEVGVGCQHTAFEGACDDGDACTTGEMCVGGLCTGGVAGGCADDGNPCTDEACDPELGCVRTVKPNRTRCEDGNSCTIDDTCMSGVCTSGTQLSCDDGNPCTVDGCDTDGTCVNTPITGLAGSCDDGDLCTLGDRCDAGQCRGGAPRSCADDGNACTSNACVPGEGCVYPVRPNRSACSDGNACTVDDQCLGGVCVSGEPASCNDGNDCTNDGCDAEIGCFNAPRAGACDDGSACSTASTCLDGGCVATQLLDCDDGNPCTVDSCHPLDGCRHVVMANNSACDDGDPCSSGETCQAGTCLATALTQCDDGNQCTSSTCLPDEGCVHLPRTGLCEDGNPCTGPDTCSNETCLSGGALACDDDNPCTQDLCDPATGCSHLSISGGTCDDSDPCTGDGTCLLGQCSVGAALSCDDGNPCTVGSCDQVQGCVQVQIAGTCDDGDPCTGDGLCQLGSCQRGEPITCDDGNDCTADICKVGLGCQFLPRTDVPCDDGQICTTDDVCVLGTCQGGIGLDCDDFNPCTVDTCGANGCEHAPIGGLCDDGNACTEGDQCIAGLCQGGAPRACDDGNSCTTDVCSATTGQCVFGLRDNGAVCDDGQACTGCPWPETPVNRGYHALDAVPDSTYFTGVATAAMELDGFLGAGTGKAYFDGLPGLRLLVLPNGSAVLRGDLKVPTGGVGRTNFEVWTVSMTFTFRGVGRAGEGAPFRELPASVQTTAFTDHWEYWTLASGATIVRTDPTADSATLSADVALQSPPLQIGLIANGRNRGLGASIPVQWLRGTRSGQGVIRLDLDRVFCERADVCASGACTGGTEQTVCRDLAAGDYCTYEDRDFGTACGIDPTTPGCILSQNFTAISLERTACSSTQRGVAFGFSNYRRYGFTAATRIDLFLPTNGAGSIPVDQCNPTSTSAAPFVGRAFALDLAILLSDVRALPAPDGVPLGELIRTTGTCAGLSLREIARRAEAVASGSPTGYTVCHDLATLDPEVTAIIQGFKNCQSVLEGVMLPE